MIIQDTGRKCFLLGDTFCMSNEKEEKHKHRIMIKTRKSCKNKIMTIVPSPFIETDNFLTLFISSDLVLLLTRNAA